MAKARRRSKGKWIQKARASMERRGTEGAFTRQAKSSGMEVQQFARHVLANKEDYSSTTVKRASFAKTMRSINKKRK